MSEKLRLPGSGSSTEVHSIDKLVELLPDSLKNAISRLPDSVLTYDEQKIATGDYFAPRPPKNQEQSDPDQPAE